MECDGYDANFVEEIPEYLKCMVCHLVLRNPLLLVNCGHRICSGCFKSMKKYAQAKMIDLLCPNDRAKVDLSQVVEDKGINRATMDLKVKCDNMSKGCPWIGELRHLQKHVDENCDFGPKKDIADLLTTLSKRMDTFEKQIQENEKHLQEKDKQIKSLLIEKKIIATVLLRNLILAGIVVLVITLFLLADIPASIVVLLCMVLTLAVACLLKTNSKRMDTCEKHLKKNEKCLQEKDNQIKSLLIEKTNLFQSLDVVNKRMDQYEKRLFEKDTRAECLQRELTHSKGEIQTLKMEITKLAKKTETNAKAGIVPTTLSNHGTDNSFKLRTLSNTMKDNTSQLKVLCDKILNVKEYVPYNYTVFEWTLQDYHHYELIGHDVYSPKFYSHLKGNCCMLSVRWFGMKNGRLGVFLHLCKGVHGEVNKNRFNMAISFEAVDYRGEVVTENISKKLVSENYDSYFIIQPYGIDGGGERSIGYGDPHFLSKPELQKFILNDSLTIKCTLWMGDPDFSGGYRSSRY